MIRLRHQDRAARHALIVLILLMFWTESTALIQAQTAITGSTFEVASIKLNMRGGHLLRVQPLPGGRLVIENCSLLCLIMTAYGLEYYQITGAPGWLSSENYDIDAKAPDGSTSKQMLGPMLQALLKDRFKLSLTSATKEMPLYELVVAKGGPKILRSQDRSCTPFLPDTPQAPQLAEGQKRPVFCGFLGFGVEGLNRKLEMAGVTMSDLAKALSTSVELSRTVIDKTGLIGKFDVSFKWAIPQGIGFDGLGQSQNAPVDSGGPSIFTAIQEQLGLRLQSGRGPVEVVMVEHIEKPTAN
jgi:uncharacterized protein (TIGR03435 family)